MGEPRLRYVSDCWAYFLADDGHGDDWNDAPHNCNAGEPYRYVFKVAFYADLELVGCDQNGDGAGRWGYLSVDQINAGEAPWLVQIRYGEPRDTAGRLALGVQIPAGVTFREFVALVREAGGHVYVQWVGQPLAGSAS